MRRSAHLVFSCRLATSIDTTSPSISRSPRIRFSAPIFFTSCQAQQTPTSYVSPNSLALTIHGRFFYTLSDILAYVQDFPMG